jgi:hypothetical protein
MLSKLSALTVTQAHIAKQKDCLRQQVFVMEDISVLERVPLLVLQILRLEESVPGDSTVLLVLHSQEIVLLVHFVVPHSW